MDDVSFLECPNCGSSDFVEIASNKHQCVYCGTILTSGEAKPDLVKCPRCGFENERGDHYCNNCGKVLVSWVPDEIKKMDLAVISIIATVAGLFIIPVGGAILGLFVGYKALRQARASGGGRDSEKRARTAIIVGWVGLALGVLPLCLAMTVPGMKRGYSICDELFQMLSDLF